MTKYFNATTGPIRIDAYGRIVGGQEWFEFKSTPEIRKAIETGDIVITESDEENVEEKSAPEAKSAGKK